MCTSLPCIGEGGVSEFLLLESPFCSRSATASECCSVPVSSSSRIGSAAMLSLSSGCPSLDKAVIKYIVIVIC